MEASVVDLRYKMKDVLKALNRREKVKILYHGMVKGIIVPSNARTEGTVEKHPFFGMQKGNKTEVLDMVAKLRGEDTMIFDTDIFIWVQKGNKKAARLFDEANQRFLSIQTYMELLQGANDKKQHKYVKEFLSEYNFVILPFTENIGHRASIYVEEYSLICNLRAGDAIIAATATENNFPLVSSNVKHFKPIRDLDLRPFRI